MASQVSSGEQEIRKHEQSVLQIKATAKIESPSEGSIVRITGDTLIPPYYVGEGRAFVVSSEAEALAEPSRVITSPSEIVGTSNEQTSINASDLLESGFDGYATEEYKVVDNDPGQNLKVSFNGNDVTIHNGAKKIMTVAPNQTKSQRLEPRMALTRTYEEREIENPRDTGDSILRRKGISGEDSTMVTPIITARNRGLVPVFSTTKGMVFPESMPNAGIVMNQAGNSDKARVKKSSSGIVTVEEVSK